jgi:hypothetical protein
VVLVDQAAQESSSPVGGVEVDHYARVALRRVLVAALVRSVLVEVLLVGAKHLAGVVLVVDQHLVGALGPDTANKRFGKRVRPRR